MKTLNIVTLLRKCLPKRFSAYMRAKRDLVLFTGGRVYSGPFSGMLYCASRADWIDCAMLLGIYERELHFLIRSVLAGDYARFVEIGHAQGYYAIGVALNASSPISVVAFEANEPVQHEAKRKAELNGVFDRITWKNCATPVSLNQLELNGSDMLFVDIDGGEKDLLDPISIPALRSCDILVETHDFIEPGITALMRNRFEASHTIREIEWKPVTVEELPYPYATGIHALCVNGRPSQSWLWMKCKVQRPTKTNSLV